MPSSPYIRVMEVAKMAKSMTLKQFQAHFPTDDACLEHLFRVRYGQEPVCPKCGQAFPKA